MLASFYKINLKNEFTKWIYKMELHKMKLQNDFTKWIAYDKSSFIVPPGVPMISGPQVIIMDDKVTLTCTVRSGKPDPSVRWLRDDTVIDETYTIVGGITTNNYTFTASANEQFAVFECQSENGLLQNPLSRTIFVEVYSK